VAAAHAGWRGLAAGVLENTVTGLGLPPAELLAWIGPGIGPTHFDVGPEVREAFVGVARPGGAPAIESAFTPNGRGHFLCDLVALARLRLTGLGLTEVYGGHWCTFSDAQHFYSYRRDGRTGRMAALIWLA
jgi:YfiH family protein